MCVSHNEPFGLVSLEAQSAGAVVLAVNQGGYKETIKHGQTGYLLPRKVEALKRTIKTLLANKALKVKIGKQAREHVVKNFSWQTHGQCLEKILQSLS